MLKLNNETKVAILAIAAIALGIWGFKFLKGLNILTTSTTIYVRYKRVDQLRPSSPVYIKGFQVGMVKDMYIDTDNDTTVVAVLNIDRGVNVPKDAVAVIVGESLMGGKAVDLQFHHPCTDGTCARKWRLFAGYHQIVYCQRPGRAGRHRSIHGAAASGPYFDL